MSACAQRTATGVKNPALPKLPTITHWHTSSSTQVEAAYLKYYNKQNSIFFSF